MFSSFARIYTSTYEGYTRAAMIIYYLRDTVYFLPENQHKKGN
jgi:hypothetical protein